MYVVGGGCVVVCSSGEGGGNASGRGVVGARVCVGNAGNTTALRMFREQRQIIIDNNVNRTYTMLSPNGSSTKRTNDSVQRHHV